MDQNSSSSSTPSDVEASKEELNSRAKHGIKTMMSRQMLTQVFTFGAGVVLARHLLPAEFGLYAIATFIVNTLAQFGSFGLAASLVQRREEIQDRDLAVAFTLQQALVVIVVAISLVFSPYIKRLYPHAPPGLDWLIRAISLNLFLVAWKTMSELQLERKLAFKTIARIEIAETLVFQALAVVLVLCGLGVWSLVIALIAKGIVGASSAYWAAPWRVRLAYDKAVARRIFRYGIPYQAQSLMNSVSSWIIPLVVGTLIGSQAVGLLSWASSNGKKPLLLVDAVMRVSFPHFARLQDDPKEVERVMSFYLMWLLIPAALWFTVLCACATSMVPFVYTSKWSPAVPALLLCALAVPLDCVSWLVAQSQSALGHVNLTLRLVVVRSIMSVVLGTVLILWFGFLGVPISYLIVFTICTPLAFSGFGKGAVLRVLLPQWWIIVPTSAGCVVGYASQFLVNGLFEKAFLSAVCSGLLFLLVGWFASPASIRIAIRSKFNARSLLRRVA
jgi:teichuronic acid exporter